MFTKSISVILPAYNEEGGIRESVLGADNYLKNNFRDYEILVVSEGSTDNTGGVVRQLEKEIKAAKLFLRKEWTGLGGALRTGFKNASKELIFYTDADRQFDIRELDKFMPLIDRYDVVTGFRIKRNDASIRSLMSSLYNWTMKILFGVRVKDVNCAFKLYKREVIEKIDFLPNVTEGIINIEIYRAALKNNYTIGEMGVHHYPRQTGSPNSETKLFGNIVFINPKFVFRYLKDAVKILKKIYL